MKNTEIKEQFDALKKKIKEFGEAIDSEYDGSLEEDGILDDLENLYYTVENMEYEYLEQVGEDVDGCFLTVLAPLTHDVSNELAIPKLEHYLATYNVAEIVEFLDSSPKALL